MRVKHAVVLLMLISPLSWAGTTVSYTHLDVYKRQHYTTHHLQLAWFSLWPDIRSRDCDNSV